MVKKLTQEQRWRRKGYDFETGRISSRRAAYDRAEGIRRMIGIPARVVKIRDDYYRVMTKRDIKRGRMGKKTRISKGEKYERTYTRKRK